MQYQNGVLISEWRGGDQLPTPPWDVVFTDGYSRWADASKKNIFIEVTNRPEATIFSTYDWESDTFTPPPPPPDYGRLVSSREFFQLLTMSERQAFRATAATNPAVEDFLFSLQLPSPIYLRHPSTLEGLATLVAEGVLTAERRDAIIS